MWTAIGGALLSATLFLADRPSGNGIWPMGLMHPQLQVTQTDILPNPKGFIVLLHKEALERSLVCLSGKEEAIPHCSEDGYLLALAIVAASARNQRRFLLELADTGRAALLTLFDTVLAIIRRCSQSKRTCSRLATTAKSGGLRSGSFRERRDR